MSIDDPLQITNVRAKVRREGALVMVTFICPDEYAAMLLRDKIVHRHAQSSGGAIVFQGIPFEEEPE